MSVPARFRTVASLSAIVGAVAVIYCRDERSPPAAVVATPELRAQVHSHENDRSDEVVRLEAKVNQLKKALDDERGATNAAVKTIGKLRDERDSAEHLLARSHVPPGADRPIPFPSDAPPQFQPAAFQALSERVAKECGLGLTLSHTECSEYPCVAVMRASGQAQPERFSMSDCGPWHDAFGDQTIVSASPDADGGMGAVVWMPVPPEGSNRAAAVFRGRERMEQQIANAAGISAP